PPNASSSKPPRILACVLCQHRKIRCDRTFPCSNCVKANVKCTPSTPAPARKRRRPNQDLQERLARCEELLKEYATEKPDDPTATTPQQPVHAQTPDYSDPFLKWQPPGKLVKEDGGVRFTDSALLVTVYDELRAMRDIVDADDTDDVNTDIMSPDDLSDLVLSGGDNTPEQSTESLWPDASHVFRLWQLYLDRVNPLSKVIHVPSLQPYLADATAGSQHVPRNIETLLFAIFLMAAVSTTADECQQILGYTREAAIQRFSSGVRRSLLKVGFLKSHDFVTLQALVVYQMSLQGRYNRHAAWILNGVIIRIAQKMGLHRDGEMLGLGPFDSEMRRRVWWQIVLLDAKFAMLSGLSHSFIPRIWDSKMPKNVNDSDIHPSATEPFQDRDGPTEMIFALMTCKFAQFLVRTPGLEAVITSDFEVSNGPNGPNEAQLAEFRASLQALGEDLLHFIDHYCDPAAGPIHEMSLEMRSHLHHKVLELIEPKKRSVDGEAPDTQERAFKLTVGALEHDTSTYRTAENKGFLWFSLLHFQIDIFMYLAGQLCRRTEGELVDRAWVQVGLVYEFHPELLDLNASKSHMTLGFFILKAWKKREETLRMRTGQAPPTPFYVDRLRAAMPEEDDYTSEATPPNPYEGAGLTLLPGADNGAGRRGPVDVDPLSVDQFLGGYDLSTLDWDMFGTMPMPMGMN
ncbi:fungal-specific transcription factor domain-containing protein, partial [Bombardia bombarda]